MATQIPVDEATFMAEARAARAVANHDDRCPAVRGRECSCRDNLRALAAKELPELEEAVQSWNQVEHLPTTAAERAQDSRLGLTRAGIVRRTARLVRVDGGKVVERAVADPISAQNPLITIEEHLPPRWVCTACALGFRGTDIDHRCDAFDLARAQRPVGLERLLAPEVRFGGQYRLTIWRDRAGEYHLGEEVVVGGRVVEERHLLGGESFNVIEGAVLDAAIEKLTP